MRTDFSPLCLFLGLLFMTVGCRRDVPSASPPAQVGPLVDPEEAAEVRQSQPPEKAPVLGQLPEFELTDQSGTSFGSEELHNHVWIANFIFTRCVQTCPRQSEQMAELQRQLQEQPAWEGIRLVSLSVDPEFDTPDVLTQYADRYDADGEHWKFLSGDKAAITELCRDGFHLPVQDDPDNKEMPILHTTKMVLVDRLGRIRGYFDGLETDGRRELRDALSFVLPEFAPPPIQITELKAGGIDVDEMTHLAQPPEIVTTAWLEERATQQRAAVAESDVFSDFQFTDERARSGITFDPQIVDEQRWRLQVNHYDHGNGICIADVDNDDKLDIYFVTQAGDNELWRNRGDGTFENITAAAGVAVGDRICVTASFADTDNDGDADLFVTTVREGNILFENVGGGRFRDATDESGLGYRGHSSAGVFFDYDRDGRLDLFLCNVGKYSTEENSPVRLDAFTDLAPGDYPYYVGTKDAFAGHLKPDHSETSILYRNLGDNRFEDVTEQAGLTDQSWSGDATPLDANGDGWQDLYVLNMQGHDEYFENQEGTRFVRKSREWFPQTSWGAMGVKVADFDRNGRMDLFVTDMHSDMSEDVGPDQEKQKSNMQWPETFLQTNGQSIFGNSLFLQDDEGKFQERSDSFGAENYWPWGLSVGDLNADGFEDAFLASSMCFPYRYSVNSVLLNDRGSRFVDAEYAVGVEPRQSHRLIAPWFELDASGDDREHPMCVGRTGRIAVWSAVGTRSTVMFDLDEDGDLDVVTNEFNTPPQVFVSNLSEKRDLSFLKVALVGRRSNRDGLGATVAVVANGTTQKQVHDGKSGYLSQSRAPLYFGLGEADQIELVTVQWPSGATSTIEGPLTPNQLLRIEESD